MTHNLRFFLTAIPDYLALLVLCFVATFTFSHSPEKTLVIPSLLFLLCHLQLILSLSSAFDGEKDQGILACILSLGERSFESYVFGKLIKHILFSSLASTMIGSLSLFLWVNLELSFVIYWVMTLFVTGLFTAQMALLVGALKLGTEHHNVLGIFLIFPFLVPSLIFAQSGFDMLLEGRSFIDYFYFNCGMSLIILGIGLVVTPKILRQALAT